jgi:cysteine-rich repeat protein
MKRRWFVGLVFAINNWACPGGEFASNCGDGFVQGEECDDGNFTNGDTCENDCTLPRCGNSIIDSNEECDDGNQIASDGCENDCISDCGDGVVNPGELCLLNQQSFSVGANPVSVAVGDFNNDGAQDLVAANNDFDNVIAQDTVSVLLGDGFGSFGAQSIFLAGTSPRSVAVGDFDSDGNQDLAVVNQASDNISILLGDGTGTFGAQSLFSVGPRPVFVVVDDFDSDSRPDLVVANEDSDSVGVLLGDGFGSFSAQATFSVGNGPLCVASGDFNNDGNQDLAAVNGDVDGVVTQDTVSVLLGDGLGSFGAQAIFTVGSIPLSLIVDDFNDDATQDLATANFNSDNPLSMSVLLGDGAGAFQSQRALAAGPNPASLAAGDLNNDGQEDIATNQVGVFLGDGAGFFGSQSIVSQVGSFVTIGDFNNDGVLDLVTTDPNSDSLRVILSTP